MYLSLIKHNLNSFFLRFMPPDDPLGRHGPSLDNFLRKKPVMPEQKKQPCPYGIHLNPCPIVISLPVYIFTIQLIFNEDLFFYGFQERSVLMVTSASTTTQKEVANLSVPWPMSCVLVLRPASLQKTRVIQGL